MCLDISGQTAVASQERDQNETGRETIQNYYSEVESKHNSDQHVIFCLIFVFCCPSKLTFLSNYAQQSINAEKRTEILTLKDINNAEKQIHAGFRHVLGNKLVMR